jgi:hypothetical protein
MFHMTWPKIGRAPAQQSTRSRTPGQTDTTDTSLLFITFQTCEEVYEAILVRAHTVIG